jgi:CubicO group peptidase (beta-lactamase class C family)
MRTRLVSTVSVFGLAPALLFAAPAVLAQPVVQAPAAESKIASRLDAVIDQAISEDRIVGAVVLVARDGEIIYRRAAGYADREAARPAQEDTIFRLASMSKPIVSLAALALADQGALTLDDPVTRWLPDFRPKLEDGSTPTITVRHLLTHTAGLNYGFLEPEDGPYHAAGVSDGLDYPVHADGGRLTLEENMQRLAAAPLLYEPGTQWHYSLATDVLGAVVAAAGGAPLPEVVKQTVTGPLGMTDTSFVVHTGARGRLAAPYVDGDPQPVRVGDPHILHFGASPLELSPARAMDPQAYPSGGAGMCGTAADYLKLLEAIRTGGSGVVKPQTARAYTSNSLGDLAVTLGGPGWEWGLGVAVLKDPQSAGVPHNPGTWHWAGLYGTHFWVDPEAKVTTVVMTNTTPEGVMGGFRQAIAQAIYGEQESN